MTNQNIKTEQVLSKGGQLRLFSLVAVETTFVTVNQMDEIENSLLK